MAIFERELPGWWWKIIRCSISVEADAAPQPGDIALGSLNAAILADERFNSGFSVELRHTAGQEFTPAELLMALLAEAKPVRESVHQGAARIHQGAHQGAPYLVRTSMTANPLIAIDVTGLTKSFGDRTVVKELTHRKLFRTTCLFGVSQPLTFGR